jgi:predicted transcriptional regulator
MSWSKEMPLLMPKNRSRSEIMYDILSSIDREEESGYTLYLMQNNRVLEMLGFSVSRRGIKSLCFCCFEIVF